MRSRSFCFSLWCLLSCVSMATASEPLASRIDQLISARAQGLPLAPLADDAEFLRRVWLDLAGRIPTADESRKFLADTAPDKRVRVIDELLQGPYYPVRMQELYHVQLMERMGDNADWLKFLRESFAANKPWDQLVREILSPDAENPATQGAAFFLTKRLENYGQNPVDLPGLTRDVGRLLLGVDLQCAQCHDHLFVDDYKQSDFQGLHTFFLNVSIRSDKKFPAVAEAPLIKKTEFMSVFKKEPKTTGPKLPGLDEILLPEIKQGEEFAVPPDRKTNFPGQLKFSPLQQLAERLPTAANPYFARNFVNRLWAQLLGQGLVHPLDLHHTENPPSHPELLDLLAREFADHQFDIKWLTREICLTETYQRSGRFTGDQEPPADRFTVGLEKPLSAEQTLWSTLVATGMYEKLAADQKAPAHPDPGTEVTQRFLKAFANPPREPEGEFAPSVKAALFLMNDKQILEWLDPQTSPLVSRLVAQTDAAALADDLYLSVMSRPPGDAERAHVAQVLEGAGDQRALKIKYLAWSLLASTEFAVNH